MVTLLVLFLALPLVLPVHALSQGWPFDSQYPLVARAGSTYLFALAASTFSSSSSVQYSLSSSPSWLQIDASGLLHGSVPANASAYEALFDLQATDAAGNIANSSANKLQISASPAPQLYSPDCILSQLSAHGQTNGADGLVLVPGHAFSLSFEKSKTFSKNLNNGNDIAAYYGFSANRTSLPPWVSFSESDFNLTFSGTAPAVNSKIAPSVQYSFDLVATDYPGYSGCIATFKLLVGAHQLATSVNSPVTIKTNSSFSVGLPLDQIFLDGAAISTLNISSVQLGSGAPDWIAISKNNTVVSGKIPENSHNISTSFSVNVYDTFDDMVSLPFQIVTVTNSQNTTVSNSTSSHNSTSAGSNTSSSSSSSSNSSSSSSSTALFNTDKIPSVVNATRGRYFQYTLSDSMFTNKDVTTVIASFDSNWLTFHQNNFTFTGSTPSKSFDNIAVTLAASYNLSKRDVSSSNDQVTFTIKGIKKSGMSASKKLAIILGVLLPLLFIILVAVLVVFCVKRRQNKDTSGELGQTVSHDSSVASSRNISKPILDNPLNKGKIHSAKPSLEKDPSMVRVGSFTTAEEELEKTISNDSSNDGSNYVREARNANANANTTVGTVELVNDVSDAKLSDYLGKYNESVYSGNNWNLVRDSSSLSREQQLKLNELNGDVQSIHSSLTDVEFGEQFNGENLGEENEENKDFSQETAANDESGNTIGTLGTQFVDTVEYPSMIQSSHPSLDPSKNNSQLSKPKPNAHISTENLLDFPSSLSSTNLSKHNRLTVSTANTDHKGSRFFTTMDPGSSSNLLEKTDNDVAAELDKKKMKKKSRGFFSGHSSSSSFGDDQKARDSAIGIVAKDIANRASNPRIPRKSWRHVVDSTRSRFSGTRRQESINSLATVSTDELFSVRLVDDKVGKTIDPRDLPHADPKVPTSDSVGKFAREDSGNIKRLDSEGNIVCGDVSDSSNRSSQYSSSSSNSGYRKSKLGPASLDVLQEENHDNSLAARISEETAAQLDNDQDDEVLAPVPAENNMMHDTSAEIGRGISAMTNGMNYDSSYNPYMYNSSHIFKTTSPVQNAMLSYSEKSRAQKAYHSRKRNLSQAYSSSSGSGSKSSSGESKGSSPAARNLRDSFSFNAGNPLPVIYSPQLNDSNPDYDNSRTTGITAAHSQDAYHRRNLKHNLSESSDEYGNHSSNPVSTSTSSNSNNLPARQATTPDLENRLSSNVLSPTSNASSDGMYGIHDAPLGMPGMPGMASNDISEGNPILMELSSRRNTRNHIQYKRQRHARNLSSVGADSNQSAVAEYDYTD